MPIFAIRSTVRKFEACKTGYQMVALAAVLVATCGPTAPAGDWPTWHGPAGQGAVAMNKVPSSWSATQNVKWKVPLPGPGNSSPIVANQRLWVTQYDPTTKSRQLRCYDAGTGEQLWVREVNVDEAEPTHPTNPYCAASPVTNGEVVVAFFGSGGLHCYSVDGQLLWSKSLGAPQHLFGQGASPLIHGDSVTLNYGPGKEQFWINLDLQTGQERWRLNIPQVDAPNPFDQPGGPQLPPDAKLRDPFGTWATATLAETSERQELILACPGKLHAVDPLSGEELWTCDGLDNQIFPTPLQIGDLVVCLGSQAMAVRLGGSGDVTDTHRVWFEEQDRARIGTAVEFDGQILANSMQGIVEALDPLTGKRAWQQRLANAKGGGSWSSLVRAGERVFATNQDGTIFVFKTRPEFELLAENELQERTNATPALAGDCIYLRTDKNLWCIGS